jgi:hypothetical protein
MSGTRLPEGVILLNIPGAMDHGVVVGTANGVVAYNCNYTRIPNPSEYDHLNYVKDSRGNLQYSGDRWQCVEYCRCVPCEALICLMPGDCSVRGTDYIQRRYVLLLWRLRLACVFFFLDCSDAPL